MDGKSTAILSHFQPMFYEPCQYKTPRAGPAGDICPRQHDRLLGHQGADGGTRVCHGSVLLIRRRFLRPLVV